MQDEKCVQCQQPDMCVGRERTELAGEVRFPLYNGCYRGYVNDNRVPLNEQQFVYSVPQKADELKPLGRKSLPHFSPNPPSYSCSEQNPRIPQCCYVSFICFLNSDEIVTAHAS